MLKTRLTEMFGLTRPIVLAPLGGGATSGRLASAVDGAGGLGLFGGIYSAGPAWIREQIRFMRERSRKPFGVGFITARIPQQIENFRRVPRGARPRFRVLVRGSDGLREGSQASGG